MHNFICKILKKRKCVTEYHRFPKYLTSHYYLHDLSLCVFVAPSSGEDVFTSHFQGVT